ncbi:SPOR domain-containing protein [Altericroceibacterium xinjiangense]|uniref:SPOR domain-containing protein n=1 Tax=Altericroceibacterium xinjiangense TaxID=762261 RepID=UPI000F7EF105|nr:SPOR domain-containing protein [Altericroceibacterium xinjiangense]
MITTRNRFGGGQVRPRFVRRLRVWTAPLLAAALPLCAQPLHAQTISRAVVQPLPPKAAEDLSEAMKALARNGRDLEALIAAGEASVALGDTDAAIGFFNRAGIVSPADGRVKAGLARLTLKQGDALAALQQFDEAEAAGAAMTPYASDRGLAYDLVGNNGRAQQLYRQALAQKPDDAVTMRLAISQAIAGDQAAADATLLPLLQQQDLAAFRTRAFALAAVGKTEEAVSIAETLLPAQLSSRMAPYLRYMPRLTRAQKAAAANLGAFPPAEEIGREDPRLLAYAGQPAPAPQTGALGTRLIPAGEPLGQARLAQPNARKARRTREPAARPVRNQGTIQAPVRAAPAQVAQAAPTGELPPVSGQTAPAASSYGPELAQPQSAQPQSAQPEFARAPSAPVPPLAPTVAPAAQVVTAVAQEPPAPANLAQAFADFALPVSTNAVPAAGAVDITAIKPPRERPVAKQQPKPKPKPKPPANPSRHWVQVATGTDVDALGFDWRRISRKAGSALGKGPFLAEWGARRRLLSGPYESADAAQKAVTELKAKGIDSFPFTSDEGEAVNPLG